MKETLSRGGGVSVQVPVSGKMSVMMLDFVSHEKLDSTGHVYILAWVMFIFASLYTVAIGWDREARISDSLLLTCSSTFCSYFITLPPCHTMLLDI